DRAAGGEGEGGGHWDDTARGVAGPARLQHQHPGGRVGGQPVRQRAPGRAATDDHEVIARLCHRPSPGDAARRSVPGSAFPGKRPAASEAAFIWHYATGVVTSPEDPNVAPASYPQSGLPDIPGSADLL